MEKMEDISVEPQSKSQALETQQANSDESSSTSALADAVNGSQADIITSQELSANISTTAATAVSAAEQESSTMIDSSDFRAQLPDANMGQYGMLHNGRLSPGYNNYATLTPLQPLPPISTVTNEKYLHPGSPPNVSHGYTFMQPPNMDMHAYQAAYNKMNMPQAVSNVSTSMMDVVTNGYLPQNTLAYHHSYQNGGMHSPKEIDTKPVISPNGMAPQGYDPYRASLPHMSMPNQPPERLHSPNSVLMGGTTLNGMHGQHPGSPIYSQYGMRDLKPSLDGTGKGSEQEEINTKELAQRISSELKRYSIPQAVFAQRVLCRSQGTLSDLLRNPKPWSKLKSGRETFRRMYKWLQEPEFQRMSALRLAGLCEYLCDVMLPFVVDLVFLFFTMYVVMFGIFVLPFTQHPSSFVLFYISHTFNVVF